MLAIKSDTRYRLKQKESNTQRFERNLLKYSKKASYLCLPRFPPHFFSFPPPQLHYFPFSMLHDGLRLQKKFWPGGLLISYITCHRLPETINEALFFSQHLVSFVRFTEVVATVACEYFAKVSVALLHNAGCICKAMNKMARFLITPGKC